LSFIEEYLEDTRKNGWDIHPKVQEAIIGWAQGRYGGPQMLSQDTIAKLESASSQQEFKDALKDTLPDEAFLIRFTANALCPNGGMP
jgi:hypothetical protein